MKLPEPLYPGLLLRRYKRFLVDVQLEDGSNITAHCPNSGSMRGCCKPGSPVLLSRSNAPGRTYPHTLELIQSEGIWVGVNTMLPNRLVREGIESGLIGELSGYGQIRSEVPYGEGSRVDLLLHGDLGRCYVEVKNVSLVENRLALFPDSVTSRGQKHLQELMTVVRDGCRGVIFFVVQRSDGEAVAPADRIDPEYGRLLRLAVASGVEALAYRALITPQEVRLVQPVPVVLP